MSVPKQRACDFAIVSMGSMPATLCVWVYSTPPTPNQSWWGVTCFAVWEHGMRRMSFSPWNRAPGLLTVASPPSVVLGG